MSARRWLALQMAASSVTGLGVVALISLLMRGPI